jgi:hypothetical protein
MPFDRSWKQYKELLSEGERKPIKVGVYDIKTFTKNRDTIAFSPDEMAWKDFIFDKGGVGSVNTLDTLFRQRYRRGYFVYKPDTLTRTIQFKKFESDTTSILEMKYNLVDEKTLELTGKLRSDSLYFLLKRSDRHFQLAERQFHWISEANR